MDLASVCFREWGLIIHIVIFIVTLRRTIVPIYQSEVSPPDHVCHLIFYYFPVYQIIFIGSREVHSHAWSLPAIYLGMLPPWFVLLILRLRVSD